MKKFLLPLILLVSTLGHAQFTENLHASIDRAAAYAGCMAYADYAKVAERKMNTSKEASSTLAVANLRLLNQSNTVQALVNGFSNNANTGYRILRTVDPSLGWEFIAEVAYLDSDGPIAINDEHPLPGRVLYKLETKAANADWETVDIRVVNRPLGVELNDIDFLTAPFGALVLPQGMLPQSEYTVDVFDLQGGRIETSYMNFGHKLKVHTSHLPFGVYQVVITGTSTVVSKYFLASGN